MAPSTAEIMSKGMKCLMEQLGVVEAEHFAGKSPEEISREAEAFEADEPYCGSAIRL